MHYGQRQCASVCDILTGKMPETPGRWPILEPILDRRLEIQKAPNVNDGGIADAQDTFEETKIKYNMHIETPRQPG